MPQKRIVPKAFKHKKNCTHKESKARKIMEALMPISSEDESSKDCTIPDIEDRSMTQLCVFSMCVLC